jgi:hypothetical protein
MRTRLLLLPFFVALPGVGVACVDSSPLLLNDVHAVTRESGTCAADGPRLSASTIDVARGTGLTLGLELRSLLTALTDNPSGRTDARHVRLESVQAKFRLASGAPLSLPPVTVPTSALLRPDTTGLIVVPILSDAAGAPLAGLAGETLLVELQVLGRTGEGLGIRSTRLDFPVLLCDGCLLLACEERGPDGEVQTRSSGLLAQCGSFGDATSLSCDEPRP